ncbi:MAG: HAMP domain-containing histidine kinase [Deltaproteobacteria bacterium]|nr:HAMP domain-containing histidine kinase [Deltaproteobacteria bacterium]
MSHVDPEPDEARRQRRPTTFVIVSFLAATVCFLVAESFAQFWATGVDRPARQIAHELAPEIVDLAAARGQLRRLQVLGHRRVHGPPWAGRAEIESARAKIDEHLEHFVAVAHFPEEVGLARQVRAGLRDLDRALADLEESVRARDIASALHVVDRELDPAAERVAEATRRAIDLNARESRKLAKRIAAIRARSIRLTIILEGLAVLVSALALVTVVKVVRSYEAALGRSNATLSRQASVLEEFAGRVAHDILSPLGAVSLALDYARRGGPNTATMLDRGTRALQKTTELVDDLLRFARSGAVPAQGDRADLREAARSTAREIAPAAASANVAVSVEPCEPCEVAASPGVVSSLLSNLLENAVKYMGDSAVRRVTVRVLPRDGAERVRVEVEDTGPGVPTDLADKLFQPHVRAAGTGQRGIGLGLATVKRLAEAHGGAVGVRSEPGKGSLFWFELPLARRPAIDPAGRR